MSERGTATLGRQNKCKRPPLGNSGPYLRKSMLIELSRMVSDVYLPEAFYAGTTFENVDDSEVTTEDQDKTLAMFLRIKIREAEDERAKSDHECSDDESSDGEEDSE